MPYTPQWERESSPTRTMTLNAAKKYYKDHNVAHTCEFWLSDAETMRQDVKEAIEALWLATDCGEGKEKPAHRTELSRLQRILNASLMDAHGPEYWAELYRVNHDYFAVVERYGQAWVIGCDDRRPLAGVFGMFESRDEARQEACRINADRSECAA